MLSIGLTGGIGSGKTQVANILGSLGASIIDTDLIAHQLTAPQGAAIGAVRKAFGPQAIAADGSMDRSWMRAQVFADDNIRIRLQNILHPLISQYAMAQASVATGSYCVFVVPLLVESGRWQNRVDRICVVDCDEETQIARVQQRSALTVATIRRIMATQASRQQRLELADDVVVNDKQTGLDILRQRTLELHNKWCTFIEQN